MRVSQLSLHTLLPHQEEAHDFLWAHVVDHGHPLLLGRSRQQGMLNQRELENFLDEAIFLLV
jgi:hypothetical protein